MTAPAVKSLEDQLLDQKEQLEGDIRQTEATLSRIKEQYLKVLGALEFSTIQKQQAKDAVNTSTGDVDP